MSWPIFQSLCSVRKTQKLSPEKHIRIVIRAESNQQAQLCSLENKKCIRKFPLKANAIWECVTTLYVLSMSFTFNYSIFCILFANFNSMHLFNLKILHFSIQHHKTIKPVKCLRNKHLPLVNREKIGIEIPSAIHIQRMNTKVDITLSYISTLRISLEHPSKLYITLGGLTH